MRFGKRHAQVVIKSHDLPCGPHFRAQGDRGSRETDERENGFLDGPEIGNDFLREAELLEGFACHDQRSVLGQRHANRLRNKGNRTAGPRIYLKNVQVIILDRILDIHQANNVQLLCQRVGCLANLVEHLATQRVRGQHHRGVPGVHTGKFNVLEHAADNSRLSITDGVHIQLNGILKELVQQDGLAGCHIEDFPDNLLHVLLAVDDEHASSTKHKTRPKEDREPDPVRLLEGGVLVIGDPVDRLFQAQLVQDLLENLAVFSGINPLRIGTDDVHPVLLQLSGQIQGCLPTKLDDCAVTILLMIDFQNVVQRQRLKVQAV